MTTPTPDRPAAGAIDRCKALVDQCLSDYGVEGWRHPAWRFDGQREAGFMV